MQKYDYIFTDLDGPILDGKYKHYNCYRDIINKYNGIPLDIDEYWDFKRNMVKRDIVLSKSDFKGTYTDYMNAWMKNIEKKKYLQYDLLKPNIIEALTEIKRHTYNLYLVTMRNNANNLFWQLNNYNLISLFDKIIICPSNGVSHPKYNALKDLAFIHAIFIGDTEEDTLTAKKLGIPCIGITNGLRTKSHLSADYYVDEIRDINLNIIDGYKMNTLL